MTRDPTQEAGLLEFSLLISSQPSLAHTASSHARARYCRARGPGEHRGSGSGNALDPVFSMDDLFLLPCAVAHGTEFRWNAGILGSVSETACHVLFVVWTRVLLWLFMHSLHGLWWWGCVGWNWMEREPFCRLLTISVGFKYLLIMMSI